MNLNKAILIGRITKDPEVKTTPGGISVARISMATNRVYKNKQGEKQEQSQFHNCVVFGRTAEIIGQFATKGQEVAIEGRIETRSYDKKDGSRGYITEIIVENFQMGSKPGGVKKEEKAEDIPVIEDGVDIKDIPF